MDAKVTAVATFGLGADARGHLNPMVAASVQRRLGNVAAAAFSRPAIGKQ